MVIAVRMAPADLRQCEGSATKANEAAGKGDNRSPAMAAHFAIAESVNDVLQTNGKVTHGHQSSESHKRSVSFFCLVYAGR
jgi:hypothetical protein